LTKQFKKAAAVLELAATLDPENAMIWTNLGAAYLGNPILAKEDEQYRAIEAFERALTLNPVAPNVAYNIGLIYRDKQDHSAALHWFQRALQTNPQDKDAHYYVALMEEKVKSEN
jgi:tetratricopeptide (TPR) repeat protein